MAVRRVDVVQYGWNMFDRRMQREILPYCEEHGIGFMAYGSLAFGLLTGTFTEDRTSAPPTGGRARGRWARSRCSTRCSAPRRSRDNVRAVEELKGIAARYDKSLPQLALRWAISHPAVSTALVGCRTVAEVEDNVGAIGWSISDADLAEIDAIFARHGVDTDPGLLDRRRLSRRHMSQELAGKVAIVTGGAGGIGRGDRRAASWRRAPRSSSPTSTPSAAKRWRRELGAAAAFKQTDVADADQVQARRRLRGRALRRAPRHVQQRRDRRLAHAASSTTSFADFDARDAREPLRRHGRQPARRRATWRSTAAARSSTPPRSAGSTPAAG